VPEKSPSVRHRVVIVDALALAVFAMTPASAAPRPKETPTKKQPGRPHAARGGAGAGARAGPASLEWTIGTVLRP